MLKLNSATLAQAAADAAAPNLVMPDAPKAMKLISVVSGCYNEEDNIRECYEQVKKVFAGDRNLSLRAHLHRQRLAG